MQSSDQTSSCISFIVIKIIVQNFVSLLSNQELDKKVNTALMSVG